ncbi:hypothetical protein BT96DRAFT_784491, partial [Gymnopus androsaceus JB14]
ELKERDIPHCTKIRKWIMDLWNEYLKKLKKELKDVIGLISFTSDLWTDPNMTPFMAVTAHWI